MNATEQLARGQLERRRAVETTRRNREALEARLTALDTQVEQWQAEQERAIAALAADGDDRHADTYARLTAKLQAAAITRQQLETERSRAVADEIAADYTAQIGDLLDSIVSLKALETGEWLEVEKRYNEVYDQRAALRAKIQNARRYLHIDYQHNAAIPKDDTRQAILEALQAEWKKHPELNTDFRLLPGR